MTTSEEDTNLELEGMDKKHSYDKWWLNKDMLNLGSLFEYCDHYCQEIYGLKNTEEFDKLAFSKDIMVSRLRRMMEIGHPKLLSQSPYNSFRDFMDVDNNGSYEKYMRRGVKNLNPYYPNQLYWVGWMYAYIHYEADMYSTEIVKKLPFEFMLEQYHLGHEMGVSVFYDKVKAALF